MHVGGVHVADVCEQEQIETGSLSDGNELV